MAEIINTILRRRSKLLKEAIQKAFDQVDNIPWGTNIFNHPLIDNLKRKAGRLPSYISSSMFSTTLVSEILEEYWEKTGKQEPEIDPNKTWEEFLQALKEMKDGNVKQLLLSFVHESTDLKSFEEKLCKWYDEYMQRVTGWFARKTKIVVTIIAAALAIALNIDTIRISQELWNDEALRTSLVQQAERTVENDELAEKLKEYDEIFANDTTAADSSAWEEFKAKVDSVLAVNQQLTAMDLPIGWKEVSLRDNPYPSPVCNLLLMILGWLITVMAISAGAPFWFKLMAKMVNIRNSGLLPTARKKKPDK
jgi:hypothetical protein